MKVFYVFNEQGVCVLTTSDERYASVYADSIEGYYCCDQGELKMRHITEENIIKIQEHLDDRLDIAECFGNKADETFYNGMLFALEILDFNMIKANGKHIILGNRKE